MQIMKFTPLARRIEGVQWQNLNRRRHTKPGHARNYGKAMDRKESKRSSEGCSKKEYQRKNTGKYGA